MYGLLTLSLSGLLRSCLGPGGKERGDYYSPHASKLNGPELEGAIDDRQDHGRKGVTRKFNGVVD